MKFAIIGYGRMGREIEKTALSRGHSVGLVIDKENLDDLDHSKIGQVDVAVEFSTPDSAFSNIKRCLESGLPVVSGTTGWLDKYDEAVKISTATGTPFLYASNFSVGVNILFHLNRELARIMNGLDRYSVEIEEVHHKRKLDAPSGTAITIARDIIRECDRLNSWVNTGSGGQDELVIQSVRKGDVPGIHEIAWSSEADMISLRHEAFSREGFALGAVFAAEYIHGKKGVFTMSDLLGF